MRFILIVSFLFCNNLFAQSKAQVDQLLNSDAFRSQFSKEEIEAARKSLNQMNSGDFKNLVNKANKQFEENPEKFENAIDFNKLK